MINSLLLHLEGTAQAEPVIRTGIALAKERMARVRGLTLLDTRYSQETHLCESAVYAAMEDSRRARAERQQESVRFDLSQACLEAQLNFDVRRVSGDPLEILAQECRFHDLVVTGRRDAGKQTGPYSGLTAGDILELLYRGVQPLLIVDPAHSMIERVLLVYDGTEPSGRAIRSYLSLGVLARAEHRLLAIGGSESTCQTALREMGDYCRQRRPQLESGYACGKVATILQPYVEKWNADLVVLGVGRGNQLLNSLRGAAGIRLLKNLSRCLYLSA